MRSSTVIFNKSKSLIDKSKLPFDNKYLVSLILPLVADTALSVMVGVADTMMVAQAGEAAVSGVSCINTLQNLFIDVLMAFSTGGAVIACQLLGMGEKDRARKACKELINITLIFSSISAILVLIFSKRIINTIYGSLEESVFNSALDYSVPIFLSMPFFALMSASNAISRSMGRSKITMNVSIVVNIINIIGNAIFLFIFHLGALGVAIASLISRVVGAVIMFIVVCDTKHELYVPMPLKPSFDFSLARMILSQAFPAGTEKTLFHVGKILISSTIASFGTASIAAYAVFNNFETLIDIPGNAISLASITVIGQCCGGKKYSEATYYIKKLLLLSFLSMLPLATLFFIFAPSLIKLYSLSPEAIKIALLTVRIDCICRAMMWTFAFVSPNMLQASGDVKLVMITAILDMWICRVFFAHVLGVYFHLGLLGTQIGMWLDWLVRLIVFSSRLISGKWKTKGIQEKKNNIATL